MIRRILAAAAMGAIVLAAAGCGTKTDTESLPEVPLRVNLIENPSFEEWKDGNPVGWELKEFDGSGAKRNIYGRSGKEKSTGEFSYYLRGVYNVDRWMVLVQRHPVLPKYRLSLSGYMKSKDLKKTKGQEMRANIYLRFYDKDGNRVNDRYYADAYTHFLGGTKDWKRYSTRGVVPKNARYAEVGLICQMTGYIYFDDIELTLEDPVPWKEIETKYVTFYYLDGHPFPEGAIDKQAAFVEKAVKMLDLDVDDKVAYYYYPSEKKYQEIIGVRKGHERALWKKKELHTTSTYDEHEIVHLLLSHLEYPPFGLAEGAVFYVLGSWEGGKDIHMMAKELLLNKQLPPLFQMIGQKEMEQVGMLTSVPGWASFSIWLIDRHGIEKFMKLYAATNEIEAVGPFNAHFKSVYGQDFDVMDRDWRLWVLRYEPRK